MSWGYGYRSEPEIVWIKTIDQLNDKYPFSEYGKKFVFAKYEVVDITHDNKIVKVTASPKKAEERKAKQLAYKKHAKCEVIVRENDIQSKLDITLANVFGTEASHKLVDEVERRQYQSHNESETWHPKCKDLIIVDRNINLELKITKVELDKFIITKTGKEMRLTILHVQDKNQNTTTITLFDNDVVDKISDDQHIKITNAEVNFRLLAGYEKPQPEGLKIPSWAKLELISEFSQSSLSPTEAIDEGVAPEPEEVRCEQKNCSGHGQNQQFFCVKCNMELCSVCIFEHKKDTSISGLECDNEICYGSRKENTLEVTQS